MDNKQQLALISEMISTARKEFNHNGNIYLLWGWLVCVAAIGQYILLRMNSEYNALPWSLMFFGAVGQMILMYRDRNRQSTKTHVGRVIGNAWAAFGISLGLTLFMQGKLQLNTFPIVMMLYAIPLFISGAALEANALKYGAIACWCCALVAFFVGFEEQLLLLAAAVIMGYIIPGYILNARYKTEHLAGNNV
ncbi:hypothetical protein [Polluticoccus soli]|uniref:hypothetical protein n=1 Tax=Polluticoccus soli TaxID=3034150 RepID=UPI0023E291B0|nr:hypothetical protein [Flavipsychrobacter sp. JY13-12]